MRLIECDNSKIGTYAKLVDDRNETAHPNGNIFFSTPQALEMKVREILRVVAEIQSHSQAVIESCYQKFLVESHNAEEREYPDTSDQIREVLVHGSYMSEQDIAFCTGFDVTRLGAHPNFAGISVLHNSVCELYSDPQEAAA